MVSRRYHSSCRLKGGGEVEVLRKHSSRGTVWSFGESFTSQARMIRRYLLQFLQYPIFSLAPFFQPLCDHSRHTLVTPSQHLHQHFDRSHLHDTETIPTKTGDDRRSHYRNTERVILLISNIQSMGQFRGISIMTLLDAGTWPQRLSL